MKKALYFDCFSGISGDMSVAALIDIGASFESLKSELGRLFAKERPIGLSVARTLKCGVSALKFNVDPPHLETDLSGFDEIGSFIELSELAIDVKKLALAIFGNLAEAESRIHGVPVQKVHFHEIGAFDSIVDIVGFSIAFRSLDIDNVIASPIALGYGSIRCRHGTYPVPAMATLELLKSIPVYGGEHECELTTPTGAAIIKTITKDYREKLPKMQVERIGYGAGTKDLENQPNVLRLVYGEAME